SPSGSFHGPRIAAGSDDVDAFMPQQLRHANGVPPALLGQPAVSFVSRIKRRCGVSDKIDPRFSSVFSLQNGKKTPDLSLFRRAPSCCRSMIRLWDNETVWSRASIQIPLKEAFRIADEVILLSVGAMPPGT